MAGFIPDIWSSKVLGALKKRQNLFDKTDRSYATKVGGSIVIPHLGDVSIEDETSNSFTTTTPNNKLDTRIMLNRQAVATIGVGVVENTQANTSLMSRYSKEAAKKISRNLDSRIVEDMLKDNESANKLKYSDCGTGVTKLTKSVVLAAQEVLNKNESDMENRYIVVDPKGYKQLGEIADFVDYNKIAYSMQNSPLRTGIIGSVYGFQVVLVPELPKVDGNGVFTGTKNKAPIIFFQKEAFATSIQADLIAKSTYNSAKAMDIVQLITIWGAKVIDPKGIVTVREN